MPNIVIDVSGEVAGSPGVARTFLYSKVSPTPPTVTLSVDNAAGITEYLWEILDQPPGASASLSSQTAASPTFVPTAGVSGTYLLQLTWNGGAGYARSGIAFLTESRSLRKPAAGETVEFGDRGWADAMDGIADAADSGGGSDPLVEAFFDEFFALDAVPDGGSEPTAFWEISESAPADCDISLCDGDEEPAPHAGNGLLRLSAKNNSLVQMYQKTEVWNGGHDLVLEARIRTSGQTGSELMMFIIGFNNAGVGGDAQLMCVLGSYKGMEDSWATFVASDDGGSSDGTNDIDTIPVVANTWYDVKIEIDSGSECRFYVNDTLIDTITTAAAIPNEDDKLRILIGLNCIGTGETVRRFIVDWIKVTPTRLENWSDTSEAEGGL